MSRDNKNGKNESVRTVLTRRVAFFEHLPPGYTNYWKINYLFLILSRNFNLSISLM